MDIINLKENGFPVRYPYALKDQETIFLIGSGCDPKKVNINLVNAKEGQRVYIKHNKECGSATASVEFFKYPISILTGEVVAFVFNDGKWNRFF